MANGAKVIVLLALAAGSLAWGQNDYTKAKPRADKTCSERDFANYRGPIGQVKCVDGKVVFDAEATAKYDLWMLDYERHREALWNATLTRVLTDKEFNEVKTWGYQITIQGNTSYSEEDKQREYNEGILQQYRLREIVQRPPCAGERS